MGNEEKIRLCILENQCTIMRFLARLGRQEDMRSSRRFRKGSPEHLMKRVRRSEKLMFGAMGLKK